MSFNQHVGWYTGLPDDCAKVKWVINTNKPVLIGENGSKKKAFFILRDFCEKNAAATRN